MIKVILFAAFKHLALRETPMYYQFLINIKLYE